MVKCRSCAINSETQHNLILLSVYCEGREGEGRQREAERAEHRRERNRKNGTFDITAHR